MTTKRTVVDTTAVIDGGGLTQQYRESVAAALPRGVDPPAEFWRDLEAAVTAFAVWQERRKKRPAKAELTRWRRIDALASKLGAELRKVRRSTGWGDSDQLWPKRALVALWDVMHHAEAYIVGAEMILTAFRGRKNPDREFLYRAICDLWRLRLGQKLTYWRTGEGFRAGHW